MSEFLLAGAGVVVFALTTWASLAFGYQIFQNMWETDLDGAVTPDRLPTDAVAPVLSVVADESDTVRPIAVLPTAAPTA